MAAPCTKCINAQFVSYCSTCMTGAPAQEEKEMVCCKSCGARIGMGIYCEPCERQLPNGNMPSTPIEAEEAARECREYNLRQLHRDAALAALSGVCHDPDLSASEHARYAIAAADEFIRQYNPDALIAEVVVG